jgi:hypothetical protein
MNLYPSSSGLHATRGTAVRRYLARVNGEPAAAASLYLDPHGCLLSGAATLPQFRRRGCQSALITRRLTDARTLTDLAVVTTAFGSASQSNLERAGFRQTHTRTAWRPLHQTPVTDPRFRHGSSCRCPILAPGWQGRLFPPRRLSTVRASSRRWRGCTTWPTPVAEASFLSMSGFFHQPVVAVGYFDRRREGEVVVDGW